MKRANYRFIPVLALVLGVSVSALPYAVAAAQPAQNDTNLQAEVINKALNKPNLKGVKATAHDGVVTLTGTVPLFGLKPEADKRRHKIKGVEAVSNEIQACVWQKCVRMKTLTSLSFVGCWWHSRRAFSC